MDKSRKIWITVTIVLAILSLFSGSAFFIGVFVISLIVVIIGSGKSQKNDKNSYPNANEDPLDLNKETQVTFKGCLTAVLIFIAIIELISALTSNHTPATQKENTASSTSITPPSTVETTSSETINFATSESETNSKEGIKSQSSKNENTSKAKSVSSSKVNIIENTSQLSKEEYIANVKKAISGDVGENETITDVRLDGNTLLVDVDLSAAVTLNEYIAIEDIAVIRAGSITDDILTLDKSLWNTVVINFGKIGSVTRNKAEIVTTEYGSYFEIDYLD